MRQSRSPLPGIANTAWWTATIRAEESRREDALFRDPFAHRLVGTDDTGVTSLFSWNQFYSWAVVVRTSLFDKFITEQVSQGIDTVINLGTGLDARPYRLNLPKSLHWIEVDHAEVLSYKESILRDEIPHCTIERVPLDLTHSAARRALFEALDRGSRRALVVCEGLVVYLSEPEVGQLAVDLASQPSFRTWILDLVSPEALCALRLDIISPLRSVFEELQFAPVQGTDFFRQNGWSPRAVRSVMQTAVCENRLPLAWRLFPTFPMWFAFESSRPSISVCLFENEGATDD